MKYSPLKLFAIVVAAFCLCATAFAADVSPAGTWKWTVEGRQSGQGFEQTLTLDYGDGKLAGTMLGRKTGRFSVPDTAISDASYQEGVIRFAVTREFNGRSFTTRYEGKLEGDTIKGTYERPSFNGGKAEKSEWLARRQK